MKIDRYLVPLQTQAHKPTPYENLLGDAIENAFACGVSDVPAMVAYLNEHGPASGNGQAWTDRSFRDLMARLGA